MLGVEARIDPLRISKTSQEQSRADERHERQRDLRRHEQAAQAQ